MEIRNVGTVLGELCVILVLILANGFFAGAEIAIIAAGRGRLQQQAEAGSRGAKIALELASNPNRFLPTVQVGITLIGTLAAAFGGAHLGDFLTVQLEQVPVEFVQKHRHEIALGIVVLGMTYLSVVVGELTPKRLALHNANRLAAFVAQPMQWLAAVSRPAVWIMAKSTDCMLWFFGVHHSSGPKVSIEDIQHLIETGTEEGVLEPLEQRLALEALHLGERTVKQIMRPRMDIDAVDVNTPGPEVLGVLAMAGFSRLPVYEENLDQIIGYVHLKDVLRQQYLGWPIDLHKLIHPALFVPETLTIDRLLQRFQEQHNQMAIVLDEFGGTEGLVTLEDVLIELVGEMAAPHPADAAQMIVQRDDHSWLVDGSVGFDDFAERVKLDHPDTEVPRNYTTIAGLILTQLDRIPNVGDRLDWAGLNWEVVDMDGPRIDRVLVSNNSVAEGPPPTDGTAV
jgi:putative hemolysin